MLPGWACEQWRWTHGVRCDWGWCSLQAGQRLATYFFLPLNRHGVLQHSCCALCFSCHAYEVPSSCWAGQQPPQQQEPFHLPDLSPHPSWGVGVEGRATLLEDCLLFLCFKRQLEKINCLPLILTDTLSGGTLPFLWWSLLQTKKEKCAVSPLSKSQRQAEQPGYVWGATQPTSGKDSWCVQVTGPDPLLLPSPTLGRNGPSILAQ